MKLTLAQIAAALGKPLRLEGEATGYSIDTRSIQPGDLFIALRGPNHDGHDHVAQALEKGAPAALVESGSSAAALERAIAVPDTFDALKRLAAHARGQWPGTLVAVTGSAGKTTSKEAIAALVGVGMPVSKTAGNLNNHIGLPLSILRLEESTRAAVVEMGMNHSGELRELARVARPDVGVVTNAGYAHIEFFDSVDGIALAKRELVESLGPQGVAVLSADDERVRRFSEVHPGRSISFGLSAGAGVRATDLDRVAEGACFTVDGVRFETRLMGLHGVRNVLAGVAVAKLFGIPVARLAEAARELAPGRMRGERFAWRGATIYNDCYNSNPDAVRAMLELIRISPARRRIAVLGEMLELGRWSEALHRDAGRFVAECGFSVLIGIRGAARHLVEAARQTGLTADAAYFFDDPADAGSFLRETVREGDVILFKGSRGTHVETALERFLE
ncbi:MAG: UDP-N-acetylmuramoyl-tripeptide--D-alanyl-D-alanine ligase [Acidobacteria bacterium]|nr:UDP-N-acetylmuramoyl-tripeptide--D-alanyl-D-alanine ligase [Acidobacteriota bacterium]